MTQELYYENPYLRNTTVKVVANDKDEHGRFFVLDKTIFYPEGGGQPADEGFIGPARVTDVQKVDGEIRHYVDQSLPEAAYEAAANWSRRWDHMQQHAGQHVLSAIFDDELSMKTTSFHLGKERVSIDLDVASISESQLAVVEMKANAVISQRLPISTEWVTQQQAATMELRKPPAVKGSIRLVMIAGIDINACGGTHPNNTAEINLIKIIGTEKAKGGTRVYFLCGNRALVHYQNLIQVTDQLVGRLNAPVEELTSAAAALAKEKAENDKIIKELRSQLLKFEAGTFQPEEESKTIVREFTDRPVKEIQQLARLTAAANPSATILFILNTEQEKRFVCAKGEEAPGDMREILKELLRLTEGRGGGNGQFAQGGGQTTESSSVFIQLFKNSVKDFQEIM